MCINYKILNVVILKNKYSLFKIQNCLNMIETTRNFNKIDLINDYWQINVIEKTRHKIAFNTKRKKYKFCVMSFRLINAFAIFQIIMNDFLRFFFDKFVIVYLNNILIYNKNDKKHLKYIILIVKAFHKKKLCKIIKLFFFKNILNFVIISLTTKKFV